MKKKSLKKMIKKSIRDSMFYRNEPIPLSEKNSYNEFIFTNSGSEEKKRSRNLIYRILSLRDRLNFHINDNIININSELSRLKNTNPTSKYADDYFSLEIIKNTGYLLTFNDKKLGFKDESLYDETIEHVRTTFDQLNKDNFIEIYSKIMKDSGLVRDSNLDDLLVD